MAAWLVKIKRRILARASADASVTRSLMSTEKFLILLSVFVGLIVGAAAEALRFMTGILTELLSGLIDEIGVFWLVALLPVAGVLLCGLYCRYVVKDDMEFGCQRIKKALDANNYRLRRHIIYGPIVSCALTLGFGGSAGSEGPIAYAGAGIGSNVGKFLGLSSDTLRILVGCGAGAGIAGIFKAPIGGALFAIEVIGLQVTTLSVLALVACCIAAWFTSYVLSGMTLDLPVHALSPFDAHMIPSAIALGIFCGIYSVYYSYIMDKTEGVVGKVANPWIKNIVSGLLIGVGLLLFPPLYGEGYGIVGDIINGNDDALLSHSLFVGDTGPWVIVLFSAGILLVKSVLCALTNSGGGVGGDFAPTLFAGCVAGMFFAISGNAIFGISLPVARFALFGMAGVMAGAIQAPLMAMFLTVEMTGDFDMFFPLMLTAIVSFVTVRLFTNRVGVPVRPTWLHRSLDDIIARF